MYESLTRNFLGCLCRPVHILRYLSDTRLYLKERKPKKTVKVIIELYKSLQLVPSILQKRNFKTQLYFHGQPFRPH